ncbi:MAG: VCBS repeat-containing protein [Planctomycetota bacterium]
MRILPARASIRLSHSLSVLFIVACFSTAAATERELISWDTKKLSSKFFGEGAFYGDFNRDGVIDIVSGPFWYEGPEFEERHEYRPAKEFDPLNYSDNFLTFVHDFNDDGWDDILVIGWPGYKKDHEHVWYENTQGKAAAWPRHNVYKIVDNESPTFGNLVGDESPELIFHSEGYLGWAAPDPSDPRKPWSFHKISKDIGLTRYAHGLGFGDVNGDGLADFVQSKGWWEQPASIKGDPLWEHHEWPFELDGAQMLVYDVDGDGDNDIVTAIASHEYGIGWMEHVGTENGIEFKMHRFINEKPEESRYGVAFSQPHALDTADFNGDGLTDFVVGKRFWAHGPKKDPEPNAAAVTYWFELKRGVDSLPGGVDFVPHLIHDDSGVGTQVAAGDVNGDGLPDVISGNKKGTHVHFQVRTKVSEDEWNAAQPRQID